MQKVFFARFCNLLSSFVYPDSLNPDTDSLNPDTDPDPAFKVNPDPIRILVIDDQKFYKKIQPKFFFLIIFLSKLAICLSQGRHKGLSKLQEKLSALKREHPALQKIKFINFFLFLWIIFALLGSGSNPDPDLDLNPQDCCCCCLMMFKCL